MGSSSLSGGYNGFYNTPSMFGDHPLSGNNDGQIFSESGSLGFSWYFGGGYYYLVDQNFQGAGTQDQQYVLDQTVLPDIAKKTTQPPIDWDYESFDQATSLGPRGLADTKSSPDLGYHYDPLDYIFCADTATANISFAAGTVVGWGDLGGEPGLSCGSGVQVIFNGMAENPCYFVRSDLVLDLDQTEDGTGISSSTVSSPPQVIATFTRFSQMGFVSYFGASVDALSVTVTNSEFRNGWFTDSGFYSGLALNLFNCLLDGNSISMVSRSGYPTPSLSLENCTVHNGVISIYRYSTAQPIDIGVKDSAFDGTRITVNAGDDANVTCNNDAYLSGGQTFPNETDDVPPVTSFDWQSGPLGNYYLPSDSSLINADSSVTADQVGLYHYTMQVAAQSIEGTSYLDIGYHYVAVDASGNPLDMDGDGLFDYFEDSNGNGVYDPGIDFSDWQNPFTDGSGMDDGWEVKYFGQINIDPYADPDGDGYVNLEEYQNGTDPTVFNSPPKGVSTIQVLHDPSNPANVDVTWNSVPSATGYTIARTINGTTTYYTVTGGGTTSWPDTNVPPGSSPTYTVTPIFSSGGTAAPSPSGNADTNPLLAINATVVRGPSPSDSSLTPLQIVLGGPVPVGVSAIRVYKYVSPLYYNYEYDSQPGSYGWDLVLDYGDQGWSYNFEEYPADGYFDVPITSFHNGTYQIPVSQAQEWCAYYFETQPIGADGRGGVVNNAVFARNVPFVDGSAVLKDNLSFVLRAGENGNANNFDPAIVDFEADPNYAAVSPVIQHMDVSPDLVTELAPYNDNWFMRNWAYDTSFASYNYNSTLYYFFWADKNLVDPNGRPGGYTAGVTKYQFDGYDFVISGGTSLPNSQLAGTPPIYLGIDIPEDVGLGYFGSAADYAGLSWDSSNEQTDLAAGQINCFGLPYQYVRIADSQDPINTQDDLAPGGAYSDSAPNDYSEYFQNVTAPSLTTVSYYFTQAKDISFPDAETIYPMPNDGVFTANDTTPLLIASVGQPTAIYGWAKQQSSNGDSTKYGFLGQYFDPTSVQSATGILSEYGDFMALQPGQFTLKTKADPDQNNMQGSCTVYAISLNVDANHDANNDGSINTTYGGPDTTSPTKPYMFWVNNNYDRSALDPDDNVNYEDDVSGYLPNSLKFDTPDCSYEDSGARKIPTKRDLEDFARLWVSGITPDLLAAFPAGSIVTLTWGDVGNPNLNNPTIDIFQAADADGGTGYLTDETTAAKQVDITQCPYIGRLEPGGSIQLNATDFENDWAGNYFIWCGVSSGSGALTLTISDATGRTLVQTTAYIQLVDIKKMYDRWSVGENPSIAPSTTPVLVGANQYPLSADPNSPYILFVHGWNLQTWEKDRWAETAFKRLYWQGYQGRFGEFRWPTDNGFKGTWQQLVTSQKDNFDKSEYNAWQSGLGLLVQLQSLNSQFPNDVYLLAHSMGNIVASEALRLSNTQVVNTYVASQAAVTAHTYDGSLPNSLFTSTTPTTPNIYGNWFAGVNGHGALRAINFYNVNDYALSIAHWGYDQQLKPDASVLENGSLWFYGYNGSASDPPPWNNFYRVSYPSIGRIYVALDIVNLRINLYEAMAYAAQAYTTALGATPGVNNIAQNVDLGTIWPPDTNPNFQNDPFGEHFYHSAEFRGDTILEWNYWNTLLFQQSGFNIPEP